MATWICRECGQMNEGGSITCTNCDYPQLGSDREKAAWKRDKETYRAAELTPEAMAKTQKEFYHLAMGQINSINSKINTIMWIIVIAVILQVLLGLRIL